MVKYDLSHFPPRPPPPLVRMTWMMVRIRGDAPKSCIRRRFRSSSTMMVVQILQWERTLDLVSCDDSSNDRRRVR